MAHVPSPSTYRSRAADVIARGDSHRVSSARIPCDRCDASFGFTFRSVRRRCISASKASQSQSVTASVEIETESQTSAKRVALLLSEL